MAQDLSQTGMRELFEEVQPKRKRDDKWLKDLFCNQTQDESYGMKNLIKNIQQESKDAKNPSDC